MAGLYLHIPFCKQACHYCNFHFSTSLKYREEMVAAIIAELGIRKNYLKARVLNSIYFGGGTPSLLTPAQLEAILGAIYGYFQLSEDAEITLEANPDDINKEVLELWRAMGINRLSIGIQSFREEELQFMNRAHTATEAVAAVQLAREAGFEDLTIDLIYGLPISDANKWAQNLEQALALRIPHLSAYCLTIEANTVFGNWVRKGKLKEAPDELAIAQFTAGMDTLVSAGYEHYEISNYALPGWRALHNSAYWESTPYLGLGPSAHSYNGKSRQWNLAHNTKYIQAIRQYEPGNSGMDWLEEETLSAADQHNEYIMTRIRTSGGVRLDDLQPAYSADFLQSIQPYLDQGHIVQKDNTFLLTRSGKLIADAITADLFV